MNFTFTSEQALLRESAEKFVAGEYPFATRRELVAGEEGFSRDNWRKFAELGWLGLGIPESAGGFGGGPVETSILMEQFGAGLVPEPYLATGILGGAMLQAAGAAGKERLARLVAGELQFAFAFAEPQARYELNNVETRAEKDEDGNYTITGAKSVVWNAPAADVIAVSARSWGEDRAPGGINVFLLDAKAPGLRVRGYPTMDGLRAGEVELDGVHATPADIVGEVDKGLAVIQRVVDAGIVAVCAEAVGIMHHMREATAEYLRHREQFGVALSNFQALQHRLVDMYMASELSSSMAYMAAVRLAEAGSGEISEEGRRAIAAAKVQIGRAGRLVGEESIQMYGGMGMTDETPITHYFKRLILIDTQFGDADHHLRLMAGTEYAGQDPFLD